MGRMTDSPSHSKRPNGFLVLVAVVGIGLLASAGLFRWGWTKVEAAEARNRQTREGAPADPSDRLDRWLIYGEPQLQNRLIHLRYSSLHPGLITHTVRHADGPSEIWGVDLSGSRPARLERDGLIVTAFLSEPRLLGHGVLTGMNADRIPYFEAGMEIPDPKKRAIDLCEHFLGKLRRALEKDIEGARLVFDFEPRAFPASTSHEGS